MRGVDDQITTGSEHSYSWRDQTRFTKADCEAAVGKRASVVLTGTIIEARVSEFGPYVKFEIDERFGFGVHHLGADLDIFEIED